MMLLTASSVPRRVSVQKSDQDRSHPGLRQRGGDQRWTLRDSAVWEGLPTSSQGRTCARAAW